MSIQERIQAIEKAKEVPQTPVEKTEEVKETNEVQIIAENTVRSDLEIVIKDASMPNSTE